MHKRFISEWRLQKSCGMFLIKKTRLNLNHNVDLWSDFTIRIFCGFYDEQAALLRIEFQYFVHEFSEFSIFCWERGGLFKKIKNHPYPYLSSRRIRSPSMCLLLLSTMLHMLGRSNPDFIQIPSIPSTSN